MKNLSLTFCLVIAALFGSVGSVFASDLSDCTFLVWKYDPNFTEAQNAALSEAGAKTLNYN